MTTPLLAVDELHVKFPTDAGMVHALSGVSLELRAGETLAVVGESGCGKSTLARTIVGIERAEKGSVQFAGQIVPDRGPARRALSSELQMIFQDPAASLNPRLTINAALIEPLLLHNKVRIGRAHREEREQGVTELMNQVGIDPSLRERYPHELSGGQRQRVSIARALAVGPKALILDEAVSALDVSIQAQILNLLVELQDKLGLAYLFITHDLAVVRHLAHRVMVMYLGQVVEVAERSTLFEEPRHPYTRALLQAVPEVDTHKETKRASLSGDVPSPLHPPSGCRFHTRCPDVQARCSREAPSLLPLAKIGGTSPKQQSRAAHQVRCWLAEP